MGWKKLKEHYQIGHVVHVKKEGICIGSPFINDIIVIGLDGTITKRYADRSNEDLRRYQEEMDADPATLARLVAEPDEFDTHIPVFTYEGGEIIEKVCEEPGWPNVTHDGCLMYENTFSTDKGQVVEWAKRSAALGFEGMERLIKDAEERLTAFRADLEQEVQNLAKLNEMYPATELAEE